MPAKMISGFSMVLVLLQALAHLTGATNHPNDLIPFPELTDSSLTVHADFKQKILDDMNWYRAQHGSANLTWNDALELSADQWAAKCYSGVVLKYNRPIVLVTELHAKDCASVDEAVDYWGLGRISYDYENPGSNKAADAFTQMVWNDTTQVGCARQICPYWNMDTSHTTWHVVCHYMPKGNVPGQFPQNVGRQISGTPTQGIASTSDEMMRDPVPVSGASFHKRPGFLQTAVGLAIVVAVQSIGSFVSTWAY